MKRSQLSYTKILLILAVFLMISNWANVLYGYMWTKTYGGGTRTERAVQTTDGGFILVGDIDNSDMPGWCDSSTGCTGDSSIFLIKTDAIGEELWRKYFSITSYFNNANSVSQTTDGGYFVTGYEAGVDWIGILIKTDADGNEVWHTGLGEGDPIYVMISSGLQTIDGGYIVTGSFRENPGPMFVYLVKTDSNGSVLWTRTFGSDAEGFWVQQTQDGGYIIAGVRVLSGSGDDMYLIRTDAKGEEIWSKTFGGIGHDQATSVLQTTDGGFIVIGETDSFGAGKLDIYLIKTDSGGNEVWSKTFGGSENDTGASVDQTKDSGYIVGGTTNSFGAGKSDIYLIKTDSDGNLMWSKTFGGADVDSCASVQQTVDDGYIMGGRTGQPGQGEVELLLVYYKPDSNNESDNPSITIFSGGGGGCFIGAMVEEDRRKNAKIPQ